MRTPSGAAEGAEGDPFNPDVRDPLENILVIGIEGIGHRLSSCQHAREIVVVHPGGLVRRWLCRPEGDWGRKPPELKGHMSGEAAFRDRGLGTDPTEIAADLVHVLKRRRVLALQPGTVTYWLHALFGFVKQPVPFRGAIA